VSGAGDGGPALPVLSQRGHTHEGMSLRDYFAAKAMQGYMSCYETSGAADWKDGLRGMASRSYEVADAMLKARITTESVEICGNCDTELPGGCGGVFRDEPSCRFASAKVKP